MPGAYLFGFDVDTGEKVKIICTPEGKLIIDPTGIFENPPTEDLAIKAASSEWSFDHAANVAAHHAKYTDVNSRAAISDIFGSDGLADKDIQIGNYYVTEINTIHFSGQVIPYRIQITMNKMGCKIGEGGGQTSQFIAGQIDVYERC